MDSWFIGYDAFFAVFGYESVFSTLYPAGWDCVRVYSLKSRALGWATITGLRNPQWESTLQTLTESISFNESKTHHLTTSSTSVSLSKGSMMMVWLFGLRSCTLHFKPLHLRLLQATCEHFQCRGALSEQALWRPKTVRSARDQEPEIRQRSQSLLFIFINFCSITETAIPASVRDMRIRSSRAIFTIPELHKDDDATLSDVLRSCDEPCSDCKRKPPPLASSGSFVTEWRFTRFRSTRAVKGRVIRC